MSAFKEKVAIGLGCTGLAIGVLTYLGPPSQSDEQRERDRITQQQSDLSEADTKNKQRYRDEIPDHIDSENSRRQTPVVPRPPEVPRLRLP